MWIIKNNSFVSIVADWDDSSMVYVRGRRESDVANFIGAAFLPYTQVVSTPNNDYMFRAHVSKSVLTDIMMAIPDTIDYTNFKNSVKNDENLHRFTHEVWSSGYRNLDSRQIYMD